MKEKHYPRLICDLTLLQSNIRAVTERCHAQGIAVAGVVKGANGLREISEPFARCGCDQIASSRLSQLRTLGALGLPTMLIRVPMLSEVEDVVRWSDYSLESEVCLLDAIEAECARQGRDHAVILMADLGDLREGWWDREELVRAAVHAERLEHVRLAGIGTNLGCYGAILPTVEKMRELAALAEKVEAAIGRPLEIVSGGATSSYLLVHRHEMPEKINHLRIGEGILLAYDYVHEFGITDIEYLSTGVFTLQAEVLECHVKPSRPIGEHCIDAFGNRPYYEDRGMQTRSLLGIGKLDFGMMGRLIPRDAGVRYIGGSSDHAIIESERPFRPGDIVEFDVSYSELLFLTASPDVTIEYVR